MRSQVTTSLSTSFKHYNKSWHRLFVILITHFLLTSCIYSSTTAPSTDLSRTQQIKSTKLHQHIVKPGETLYAIAWRHNTDYKVLAKLNKIGSDFLIFPGQVLDLTSKTSTAIHTKDNKAIAGLGTTAISPKPSSSTKNKSASNVSQSSPKKSLASTSKQQRSEKKSPSSQQVIKSKKVSGQLIWRWPTKGKVITNFLGKNSANKGIDLLGKKGDSISAAADGTIVYAGSGLRGYGQLIIIKHNDIYLSAYAHNDRVHVKEGQFVKVGQHIADIGSSGSRAEQVKLHFEIRRNGQPINPLTLLPKRKS